MTSMLNIHIRIQDSPIEGKKCLPMSIETKHFTGLYTRVNNKQKKDGEVIGRNENRQLCKIVTRKIIIN